MHALVSPTCCVPAFCVLWLVLSILCIRYLQWKHLRARQSALSSLLCELRCVVPWLMCEWAGLGWGRHHGKRLCRVSRIRIRIPLPCPRVGIVHSHHRMRVICCLFYGGERGEMPTQAGKTTMFFSGDDLHISHQQVYMRGGGGKEEGGGSRGLRPGDGFESLPLHCLIMCVCLIIMRTFLFSFFFFFPISLLPFPRPPPSPTHKDKLASLYVGHDRNVDALLSVGPR